MPDFLYLGHSAAPAAQPPDADEIESALQAAIENAVIRFAVTAGAIDDVAMKDAKNLLDDQRRDKAMGAVEERQLFQDGRMDRPSGAGRVAGFLMLGWGCLPGCGK